MTAATHSAVGPAALDSVRELCDDIAEHFKPVTGYERRLVEIGARAYERYEQALELERQAFAKTNPLEMLAKQPDLFKAVTRHVADAERGWRKALEEIRRAIRQRPKTHPVPPPQKAVGHPAEVPLRQVVPQPAAQPHARRE